MSNKSLHDIQQEILEIKMKAFSDYPNAIFNPAARAFNMAEETGELAREERLHLEGLGFDEARAIDAVGDLLMATIGYCIARGWNAQLILEHTFDQLKQRWESGQLVGIPNSDKDERKEQWRQIHSQ